MTGARQAILLRAAIVGAIAWAAGVAAGRWELASALLLLSPLVLVPLGLAAIAPPAPSLAWSLVCRLQLPAALLAGLAFALPPGGLAALLIAPWSATTLLIAVAGVTQLQGLALRAAPAFLAVGGAWALATRAGFAPLGFEEPIVLLTAAHFHHAGFVLPLLAGLGARSLPGLIGSAACAGVVAGVPLTAAGITLHRHLGWSAAEWLTAWLLVAAAGLVALQELRLVALDPRGPRAVLLVVSAAGLGVGLAFAAAYALGQHLGATWLDIPTMVRFHACAMVLGFGLPGLLAFTDLGVELRRARRPSPSELEPWERRALEPEVAAGPGPHDHEDAHERDAGQERPGPPEPDGPHRRAAAAILAYDVFPPAMLAPLLRRTPVQVGDTVGARYHVVPGLDLLFASRVVEVFDGPAGGTWRTGFTYRTLPGHAELGEETFSVEKELATGRVRVALRAWSRPRGALTRAFAPLARLLQLRAGRAAAERLARLARA